MFHWLCFAFLLNNSQSQEDEIIVQVVNVILSLRCILFLIFIVDSLFVNLSFQKPWDPKAEWPFPAAEVYFLIGMAYTDLVDHNSALDAFNNALKINPEYSEVLIFVYVFTAMPSKSISTPSKFLIFLYFCDRVQK